MTQKIAGRVYASQATPSRPDSRARRHKYSVGQTVTLVKIAGTRLPRKVEDTLGNEFQVTRLLPEQGADFHYRIKSASTEQERVVSESEIRTAS